jgi:ABC-type Mn2+/Zn2+ transport system permease subunit/Mn-dependent DtxR family transcriptional regulator
VSTIYQLLAAPLVEFAFMRYALAVVAIVGVTSAILSCLLVVRRQALLGDAISHSVLLGVVLGWLVAQEAGIFWGALAAGILTGFAITGIERGSRVKFDAAMGIVFTFAFALGLAIISIVKPRGIDLFHVLLGNVLGVGQEELVLTAISCGAVLVTVLALFRGLHLWSFDPVMAQVAGLPTGVFHYLFTAMLSATIVASIQAVGLVLVIAMLITPGATAYLLTDRLGRMMAIAAAVGLVAGLSGLYGSYYLDVASGPAMVVVVSLCFALAFAFAPRRGVVAAAVLRFRQRQRVREEDALRVLVTAESEEGAAIGVDELARRTATTPGQARRSVNKLEARGLVFEREGALHASDAGRRRATELVRAHRLIERYLHDVEGVPIDELHRAADRMEHEVSHATLDAMDDSLGRPNVDPHGHRIPGLHDELRRIAGTPLAGLPRGRSGRVSMVRDDRDDLLRDMAALGILPDATVTMVEPATDPVDVAIDGRRASVSRAMAERVFVMPRPAVV